MNRNDTCGMMIMQIHNALEKECNQQLKENNLTFSQMRALHAIIETPSRKMSFKELEKVLMLAQSTTVGLISRLEQKKLVSVSGDRDDKRIKYVEITSLGEAFCKSAEKNMIQSEEKLLSNLSDSEREIFIRLLKLVNETMNG
ncbi:MAG: MarR family winged helix-turn-helix transcriptional regulator [Lachnospiraceae bacterium]